MTESDGQLLHPETAKQYSIVMIILGAGLAGLGTIPAIEMWGETDTMSYGAVAVVWAGLATIYAGNAVRSNRVLMKRPRWFLAAYLFGIASSAGIAKSVWIGDTVAVMGLLPMQALAPYALWRACRR